MKNTNRPFTFWVIITFLIISLIVLLIGQTMALINYDFAVQLGLQESLKDVGQFGIQTNRAFAVADTIVYIPLIVVSIIGLLLKKCWSLYTTAAVMGISIYWSTTIIFMLIFLKEVPNYHLEAGLEYWLFLAPFIIFGIWGLLYLVFRGEHLIATRH